MASGIRWSSKDLSLFTCCLEMQLLHKTNTYIVFSLSAPCSQLNTEFCFKKEMHKIVHTFTVLT